MNEEQPFKGGEEPEPTMAPLKGPNVTSTFDTPPSPDAVKVHDAAIRKHLQDRKAQQDPPAGVIARTLSSRRARTALEHFGAHAALADPDDASRLRLAAHERERDRAEPGGDAAAAHAFDGPLTQGQLLAGARRLGQAQPAQVAVGLALVVQARDRLLAHVAALGEAHRALVHPASWGMTESSRSIP